MERSSVVPSLHLHEEGEEEDVTTDSGDGVVFDDMQQWEEDFHNTVQSDNTEQPRYYENEESEEEEEEAEAPQHQGRNSQDSDEDTDGELPYPEHTQIQGLSYEGHGRLLRLLSSICNLARYGTNDEATEPHHENEDVGGTVQFMELSQPNTQVATTTTTTFTTTTNSILTALRPISQGQRIKRLIAQCTDRIAKWRSRNNADPEPTDVMFAAHGDAIDDTPFGAMPPPVVGHLALAPPIGTPAALPTVAQQPLPPAGPRPAPWRQLLDCYTRSNRNFDETARLATRLGGVHVLAAYARYFLDRVTDTAPWSMPPVELRNKFVDGFILILQRLRSLSAYQPYKAVLYDAGALRIALDVLRLFSAHNVQSTPAFLQTSNNTAPRALRSTLEDFAIALVQNLSEHRFHDGTRNPNQVKIFQDGAYDVLLPYLRYSATAVTPNMPASTLRTMLEFKFLAHMTVANIAMNEENLRVIYQSPERLRGLEALSEFPAFYRSLESTPEAYRTDIFTCWVTFQPFVGLLASSDPHIQRFALFTVREVYKCVFCFAEFQYDSCLFYHAFVASDGRKHLQRMAVEGCDGAIRAAAADMLLLLRTSADPATGAPVAAADTAGPSSFFGSAARPTATTALQMLERGQFADVMFVVDGQRVRAHRVVLAARSPVFAAMFAAGGGRTGLAGGLRESRDGAEVEVRDIAYEVFVATLKWVYGCAASRVVTSETALELLHAAEMFALEELKSEIEDYLVDYVDVDTVFELSRAAVQYRCAALKKACLEYLQRNWFELQRVKPEEVAQLDECYKQEIEQMLQELE